MRYKARKLSCFVKRTPFLVLLAIVIFGQGCQTVKPYQRVYLNDENMRAGKQSVKTFAGHVHNYREGSTGGGNTNKSGGCGCN
jgi:hypothetical protein